MRQHLSRFRRADAETGIVGKTVVTSEIPKKTAPCGKRARERPAVEPARVQLRDEAPDLMHLQFVERRVSGKLDQRSDVALVIGGGMRRQAVLVGEMGKIFDQIPLCDTGFRILRAAFRCWRFTLHSSPFTPGRDISAAPRPPFLQGAPGTGCPFPDKSTADPRSPAPARRKLR